MEEKLGDFAVAPGEGAWIEIFRGTGSVFGILVAPGEGAYIKMQKIPFLCIRIPSHFVIPI